MQRCVNTFFKNFFGDGNFFERGWLESQISNLKGRREAHTKGGDDGGFICAADDGILRDFMGRRRGGDNRAPAGLRLRNRHSVAFVEGGVEEYGGTGVERRHVCVGDAGGASGADNR